MATIKQTCDWRGKHFCNNRHNDRTIAIVIQITIIPGDVGWFEVMDDMSGIMCWENKVK